jgi:hypothetical protein
MWDFESRGFSNAADGRFRREDVIGLAGEDGRLSTHRRHFDPTWTAGRDFAIENGRNAGG